MNEKRGRLQALPLPVTALVIGGLISAGLLLFFELQYRPQVSAQLDRLAQAHNLVRAATLDLMLQRVTVDYQRRVAALARSGALADHLLKWRQSPPSARAGAEAFDVLPAWFPEQQWHGARLPLYLLLMDGEGKVRGGFSSDQGSRPSLLEEATGYLRRDPRSPQVFVYEKRVYLLVFAQLPAQAEQALTRMAAIVPLDDAWARKALHVNDVLLVSPDNRGTEVGDADGTAAQVFLQAHANTDGSGPVLYWRMPRFGEQFNAELAILTELERADRLLVVFVLVLTLFVFALGVTFWLRGMYTRVRVYSRQMLHMTPPPGAQGNQLLLLEQWIRSLINLVREAEAARQSQHETEILRSEAVKSAVMDASLDSVVTIDAEGKIIEFNPAAELTFDYAREQVIGERFQELLLRPASKEMFDRQLAVVGKSSDRRASPRLHELQVVTRRGKVLEVELAIQQTAVGDEAFYAVYLRDITARRKQEDEIRNLAAFPRESPMPVLRVNRPGVVVYANNPSDPVLAHWGCLRLQTLPIYWRQQMRELLDTGITREVEITTDQGIYSLLLSPNPDLGYVNIYGRDVSAMRRAQDEARRRQNELVHVARLSTMGEMATGIAHELNQPLSAIVNFANGCVRRLKLGVGGTEDLLQALSQISAQATRAGEIIKRLRAMVGKQQPVRELLDLNQLVREVCQLIEHEAEQLNITLLLEVSETPLLIRVDGVQIEQVLLNVLRNALDALEVGAVDEPCIRITSAEIANDLVYVAIKDNGPGIPPSVKEHLFDPFFTTKDTGMGMGLAISQTIVAEHNGRMYADSWPGRGAIFTIELPAAVGRTEVVAS